MSVEQQLNRQRHRKLSEAERNETHTTNSIQITMVGTVRAKVLLKDADKEHEILCYETMSAGQLTDIISRVFQRPSEGLQLLIRGSEGQADAVAPPELILAMVQEAAEANAPYLNGGSALGGKN